MLAATRTQKDISVKNAEMKRKLAEKSSRKARRKGGELYEAELLRDPEDIRNDPKYAGSTEILLKCVPLRCIDESTEVDSTAIREWLIYAVVEEDPASQVFFERIQRYNELIQEIEANMKKIPKLQFFDESGRLKAENDSRMEREKLFTKYGEELVLAESGLDDTNRELKAHVEWRKKMTVDLSMVSTDKNTSTANWLLSLSGTDDAQEIEDLLILKRNWQGIKMACGYKLKEPQIPPWSGRGDVPNGTNPTLPNYTGLEVNMLGVRIMRIPTGIGFYRQLDRSSSTLSSDRFGFYYGEYEHGEKQGYGLLINDTGVFSGSFENNFRNGHGRMDYADGTTIIGNFNMKTQSSLPSSGTEFVNPYLDGEPNGLVEIFFSDGAFYRGNMTNGEITGQGDYQSAFNEIKSGTFEKGYLHGKNGFYQTSSEDVYIGSFHFNELHGYGTYLSNRTGDSYDGYWENNLRHGRGVSKYTNVGCHRGYYINDVKHGKGSLEYGRLLQKQKRSDIPKDDDDNDVSQDNKKKKEKETRQATDNDDERNVIDKLKSFDKKMQKLSQKGNSSSVDEKEKADGKDEEDDGETKNSNKGLNSLELDFQFSPYENIYQGFFLGNNISNEGSVMNTMKQVPSIISRLDKRKIYPIQQVLRREYHNTKKSQQIIEKDSDLEYLIRLEIIEKKLRIYKQQKHFAKKMIYDEDVYNKFDYSQLEHKMRLRTERLEKAKHLTEDNDKYFLKKARIPRLKLINRNLFTTYTQGMDRIQPEEKTMKSDDYINNELLKAVLSDFEEVRERQRFLKYDFIWQRAEAAYESNHKANR
jgi:hypothetical protein